MDILSIASLAGVGVIGGIIASIVGGAAVVTYPALIAAGVPPHVAAACNLTALVPGTMLAAVADRTQLPTFNRAFVNLILASVTGAACGALLLLLTPERTFAVIVPLLLGFATVLFAFTQRIGAWLRMRAVQRGRSIEFSLTSLKFLLPVSLYSGYFGAGAGIILLAVCSVATDGDYRSANVTKNFVSSLNSFAASLVFAWQGAIVWPPTLAMMAGMLAGGYAGAHIARVIPRNLVRILVVVCGAALTVAFARRYWF
jgi:uncharacterized membrane protein YfcA